MSPDSSASNMRWRIFLRSLGLLVLLVGVVCGLMIHHTRDNHREEVQRLGLEQSLFMARQCRTLLSWGDRVGIHLLMNEAVKGGLATYAWLERKDEILAQTFGSGVPRGLLDLHRDGSSSSPIRRWRDQEGGVFYDIVTPVPFQDARLHLGVSMATADARARGPMRKIVLTGLIALALGAGLSFGIALLTTREIDAMSARLASREERLRHSQKMEGVGRLAGGVAHDFNNLLTAILGYCTILLEATPEGDPRRPDILEIRHAAKRAASLTGQLLAFSRKQLLRPTELDLKSVLENLAKMLHRLIGEHIQLEVSLAKELPLVMADHTQMEQVIMNLAINARDAMPHGGRLTLDLRDVVFDSERPVARGLPIQPGRYVRLTVGDTGVGMDEDTLGRIFEPFFTTKAVGKGTGLGLSTVYGIIAQSGGHLDVTSAPGQGTTFQLFLEALPRSERHDVPEGSTPPPEVRREPGAAILLIEDDQVVRRVTARLLRKAGHQVLEAACADDALAHQRDGAAFHLVLTDVVMPGMSGVELGGVMKRAQPELRIIYTSGYADAPAVLELLARPDTRFLQKPYSPHALLAAVSDALAA